jgi:hypothetical protein
MTADQGIWAATRERSPGLWVPGRVRLPNPG